VITPRLFRRSLRQALQWRLLALWWASLLVPGLIAAHPVGHFLRAQLDRSTRAKDLVAWIDGATLLDLARQVEENGAMNSMALRRTSFITPGQRNLNINSRTIRCRWFA